MPRTIVRMPSPGETVEEVLILEWQVAVGDSVESGQPLVSVEADKVDADVPAPVGGTVVEILVAEGNEIPIGAPVCVIDLQIPPKAGS